MSESAPSLVLDADLVAEAEALGIDIARAAETGVTEAVRDARAERWKRENRAALESSNQWVEQNGLPLAKYRQF